MKILDLLKGKKIKVMTNLGVEVVMTIKKVEEIVHREALEPATRENDWYPRSTESKSYKVTFDNDHSKSFVSLDHINIVD